MPVASKKRQGSSGVGLDSVTGSTEELQEEKSKERNWQQKGLRQQLRSGVRCRRRGM